MKKALAGLGVVLASVYAFAGTALAAPTPPDVGTETGPVLDAGLDAVLAAFVDLAPWLIPAGIVVMFGRKAIRAFSSGRAARL